VGVGYRFDGAIAGIGTASGARLVVGIWPTSPFGPVCDAMIQDADGRRMLLAPTVELGDFVAATYRFDVVRVEPLTLVAAGRVWTLDGPSLQLRFETGPRTALGQVLTAVPRPLARSRLWARAIDPVARAFRPGVRTAGTAGGGRREFYCALDEHRLIRASATLDGAPLGDLRPLVPPVSFGFGSTPARPSIVRVTTLIDE
jgi:hypothetical protein